QAGARHRGMVAVDAERRVLARSEPARVERDAARLEADAGVLDAPVGIEEPRADGADGRVAVEAADEGLQPARTRNRVVVQEHDELAGRSARALVARRAVEAVDVVQDRADAAGFVLGR